MISQLIKIFGVKNYLQLVFVFVIFSISGILSLYISDLVTKILFNFLSNSLILILLRILLLFLIYQIVLILVSIPFGQFRYFIYYEKKLINRIKSLKLLFLKKK